MSRAILHADMDAFFASVEQRDDPSLQGKPLVVGGAAPRGVVAAASYEARVFGIHSAMPMIRAQERCPELLRLDPRMERYAEVSRQVFTIFRSYSPLVEGLSLDEAFIDVTGSQRLHGDAVHIAREIKRRVSEELDLVVSLGVGPNKMVAKIASDLDKPDGLRVVDEGELLDFLHPLPVRRLFGVGKVTGEKLASLGIRTIGDLATYPKATLLARLGSAAGEHLYDLARGVDERAVEPVAPPKSLGAEDTFTRDIDDDDELEAIVRRQADLVGERLRAQGFVARVVTLKAKSFDHKVKTRQKRLGRPTNDGAALGRVARTLLPKARRGLGGVALRLTGVSASELSAEGSAATPKRAPLQLTLGGTEPRAASKTPHRGKAPKKSSPAPKASSEQYDHQLSEEESHVQQGVALARTLDAIADRFGKNVLQRGPGVAENLLRRRDSRASGAPETDAEEERRRLGEPSIEPLEDE